jgi:PHD/YefM family antitoxin component YafN of YafNO toxin-antitoxin module
MAVSKTVPPASKTTPEGKAKKSSGILSANYAFSGNGTAGVQYSSGLNQVGGTVFGRNINDYVNKISANHACVSITIRKKTAAVVLSAKDYDQLVSIRAKYETMMDEQKNKAVETARNQFDELYALMSSKKSANVMRDMINVTGAELAETYKPGRTENN